MSKDILVVQAHGHFFFEGILFNRNIIDFPFCSYTFNRSHKGVQPCSEPGFKDIDRIRFIYCETIINEDVFGFLDSPVNRVVMFIQFRNIYCMRSVFSQNQLSWHNKVFCKASKSAEQICVSIFQETLNIVPCDIVLQISNKGGMNNKLDRKEFLAVSMAGLAGTFLFDYTGRYYMKAPVGLQLYTIRDQMKKDVPGTLKTVAETGYKNLELAGYKNGSFYDLSPGEFRKIAADNGLSIISSHIDLGEKFNHDEVRKIADDHIKLGARFCVQPSIPSSQRKNSDGYRMAADAYNKAGEIMNKMGLKLGYHNHNFEFAILEGKVPYYDILLRELDKDLVTMELDIYWAIKAGQDPIKMFNSYPGRFGLFHLKDMYKKQKPFYDTKDASDFAPVGEGMIDFGAIIESSVMAGVEFMFVEQDDTAGQSPIDAIGTSLRNLARITG